MKKLIYIVALTSLLLVSCSQTPNNETAGTENTSPNDTPNNEQEMGHHIDEGQAGMMPHMDGAQPGTQNNTPQGPHMNGPKNGMGHHMGMGQQFSVQSSTGENELAIPPILEADKIENGTTYYTIEAQEGTTEFFQGKKERTLGYNGDVLGPAIRVKNDENVHITLKNDLQEDTTVHWHGLIVGGPADGGPHDVIEAGEQKEINFTIQQDGATLWFHPHPLGKTAKQVYEGLAGLLLIENEYDDMFTYGENDFPLIIQDKMFADEQLLSYEEAYHPNGVVGNTILINGTVNPKLTVNDEQVRLRLLNGSNTRTYTFSLNNDKNFIQIAADGGILPEPLETDAITLAPAERAEIIVDFSAMTEDDIALIAGEDTKILPFTRTNEKQATENAKIIKQQTTKTVDQLNLEVTKKIELFGMGPHVTINGKKFDPNRIDFKQQKGVTEVWEVYNKPDMMSSLHPFHIHGTQFNILSINGKEPPPHLRGLKDTINLQPGDRAQIAVSFPETGIYMYHCHILEHEDNGMMGQVEVYE